MQLIPLIQTTRGGHAECVHFGAIAVADAQGKTLAQAGDAGYVTFTRSSIKPFQALPFLHSGGAEHFGLESEQIALLCASHNGETMHVQQVERILAAAGQGYKALRCGFHLPLQFTYTDAAAPAGLAYDERHHNCSGKHSGFLAYCVQHGLPLETYLLPAHPLQMAVRESVAQAVGMRSEDLLMGIDGCSAPNFAMPLLNLAQGFARLASEHSGTPLSGSFKLMFDAMTAHPELVSGMDRNDVALMQAGRGDWVSKIGADGVQVVGSRSRAQAFALKISDGSRIAAMAATVEALEQLGWLDDAQRTLLMPWRSGEIRSIAGAVVGLRRAVFLLH